MKRILFVDDEANILDGIRRMLYADRKRWEMKFAVGGEAALEACEAASFDLVISDMRMPGMDGATLLGHIRDRYPGSARIILSGYSEAALTTRAAHVAHRFLSKPCDPAELQSTIERVCALQDILNAPEIRNIVGTIGELPSLSDTYASLSRALQDPDTQVSTVAEIIQQDVAMSAKVLQLANSAFFGLAQNVTSLHSAVSYLGIETIKNLALASEVFKAFVPDARIPEAAYESLQLHAHRVAGIVSLLPVEKQYQDLAIVAALLHDIGRLFLASTVPDTFLAISARAAEGNCSLVETEEQLLGTSHAEIGAYLLGLWGIPNLAIEAIAHHHRPTRIPHPGFDTSVAVYVANLLANEIEARTQGLKPPPTEETEHDNLEALGLLTRLDEFRALIADAKLP